MLQWHNKPYHTSIGNGKWTTVPNLMYEKGDDRTPGCQYVSKPDYGENGLVGSTVLIGCYHEPLSQQLAGPHHIDRIYGFVSTDKNDFFNGGGQTSVNNVLRPEHVGFDCLKGVVLAKRYVLQCRCMKNKVDAFCCALEPFPIPHVSDKEPELADVRFKLFFQFKQRAFVIIDYAYY